MGEHFDRLPERVREHLRLLVEPWLPVTDGARDVAYASIGIRRDVPQMLVTQDTRLARDVTLGDVVQFEEGPVQKTSPVYAITVFDEALPPARENAALAELTEALTERFVDINNETLHG